jgi:xylulokinase
MPKYALGIDVGTGGSRALLIDAGGSIVASATTEHVPFASPRMGWAEQDPQDWWSASASSIRSVLHSAGISGADVAAVGLAGQMHGAVLLDEQDAVLRPALIWCDQRTEAQCEWLNEHVGRERLLAFTSNPALTNFTLTKLLWVRDREPQLWARFRRFLLPKDYVRFRLTGEHAMDVAEASGTLMLDVKRRRWSLELLEEIGLPSSCLPRLFESPENCALVSVAGAAATGLVAGTPVVAGAGDQAAGAVGMGIVRPGTVSATIGTSGVVFAATDRPATDQFGRLHTFCHAVPNTWHVMGVTQAAGLSLRWVRDNLQCESYDEMMQRAGKSPPGANGLIWLPYLMGERTPHLDPNARGALIGINASHTTSDVIRAVLEGVAFSLRDSFALIQNLGLPVNEVRLGGGGARSPLWRQIQADIYGHDVHTVQTEEGAAYGAALLAGVGARFWNSVEEACDSVVRVVETVAVQPTIAQKMQSIYSVYADAYPALKPLFRQLHELD